MEACINDTVTAKARLLGEKNYWRGKSKSYSMNLPREWGEKHSLTPNGGSIQLYELANNLVLVPKRIDEDRIIEIQLGGATEIADLNKIATAYVRGFDAVQLEGLSDFTAYSKIKSRLQEKFEILEVKVLDEKLRVYFNRASVPIKTHLDRQMQLCENLYLKNKQILSSGANEPSISDYVAAVGEEQDRVGYSIKRFLHLAAEEPEILVKLDVNELNHLLYYASIGERLERMGDMYEDIFKKITTNIDEPTLKSEWKQVSKLLAASFEYAKEAYESKGFDESISLRVKKKSLQDQARTILDNYRKGGTMKKGSLAVYDCVGLCDGIVGIASNIVEDWAKIYCPGPVTSGKVMKAASVEPMPK